MALHIKITNHMLSLSEEARKREGGRKRRKELIKNERDRKKRGFRGRARNVENEREKRNTDESERESERKRERGMEL